VLLGDADGDWAAQARQEADQRLERVAIEFASPQFRNSTMIGAEQIGDVVDVPAGHELRELDAELSLERGNGIGTAHTRQADIAR